MANNDWNLEAELAKLQIWNTEELRANKKEILKMYAVLCAEKEKLFQERDHLYSEKEEMIQKINSYKIELKEFVCTATMKSLNMTSVLDFILYINETLVICEVGLKQRRQILRDKLPKQYSSLLKQKDYSNAQRLKKAILKIEQQFHIAGGVNKVSTR